MKLMETTCCPVVKILCAGQYWKAAGEGKGSVNQRVLTKTAATKMVPTFFPSENIGSLGVR